MVSCAKDYIVLLNDEVPMAQHMASLANSASITIQATNEEFKVHHLYDLVNAYAARIPESVVEALKISSEVKHIEENQVYSIFDVQKEVPSWGLTRISERKNKEHEYYSYPKSAGEGVNVYIIDTGVNVHHQEFEGRARWGAVIPAGDREDDGQGHGTHVAGTVAGKTFGVAKKANIVAVKVLKDDGSGNLFDVIKGIDWAAKDKKESGKPGLGNMSLGGPKSFILDIFVRKAIAAGLQFAVAAGNSNEDACTFSPANVEEAVSVGATNATDERAFFSNWGKCVTLFAPGFKITSAWKDSKSASYVASGTSMASPHVAGVLALILGEKGDLSPSELKKEIVALATKNVLQDNLGDGSPNLFLYNGVEMADNASGNLGIRITSITRPKMAISRPSTVFF